MEALPIVYAMATSMSGIVPWQQKHVGQIWGWIYRLTTHTMLFCFLDDLIPFGGHLHSASAVHSGNRPQNMRRWVIDSGIQRCDIFAVAGVCNWHRWEWHGEGPSARMLECKCATSQRPLVNFFYQKWSAIEKRKQIWIYRVEHISDSCSSSACRVCVKKHLPFKVTPAPSVQPSLSRAQRYVTAGAVLLVIAVLCAWEPWWQ